MIRFTRAALRPHHVIVLALSVCFCASADAQTLQITSPAPGTVINPGQTITVYVQTTGGPFSSVMITVPEPGLNQRDSLTRLLA